MKRHGLLLAVACGMLVACSGEPSDQEINAALQEALSRAKAGMGPVAGDIAPTISNVRKIGCTRSDWGGYLCDVEFDLSGTLMAGRRHLVNSSRFVKSSSGWSLVMPSAQ